ncbi:MAG: hypothetical protein A2X36_07100 [Elusimicrobia bacterium GWA2_69_24]|nr:MAG: hypothetical protein A2X36_07100 [Elusimicrobia bacterium GWA2_69_24]HBL15213.1 hypothetical protein [Elusimicrobiota bacterium]
MSENDPEHRPTIVGPQPGGSGGRRAGVPRGLERLVALGALSPEWRGKVLAGPEVAAREAGLELSATEQAVLKSIPRKTLEAMIASFERISAPVRPSLMQMAAGSAAAALLAASLSGCDALTPVSLGISPDAPEARPPQAEPAPAAPAQPSEKPEDRILIGDPSRSIGGIRPDPKPVAPAAPEESEDLSAVTRGISPDEPPPGARISKGLQADEPEGTDAVSRPKRVKGQSGVAAVRTGISPDEPPAKPRLP